MKIRQGFVSNSSSSSFCILGVVRDSDFDEPFDEPEGLYKRWGISDYNEEDSIIGLEPESIKEDETISAAKDRIVKLFKEAGHEVKKEEIDWHIDGGYNG